MKSPLTDSYAVIFWPLVMLILTYGLGQVLGLKVQRPGLLDLRRERGKPVVAQTENPNPNKVPKPKQQGRSLSPSLFIALEYKRGK